MKVKVTTSIAGLDYAFYPSQIVELDEFKGFIGEHFEAHCEIVNDEPEKTVKGRVDKETR